MFEKEEMLVTNIFFLFSSFFKTNCYIRGIFKLPFVNAFKLIFSCLLKS